MSEEVEAFFLAATLSFCYRILKVLLLNGVYHVLLFVDPIDFIYR